MLVSLAWNVLPDLPFLRNSHLPFKTQLKYHFLCEALPASLGIFTLCSHWIVTIAPSDDLQQCSAITVDSHHSVVMFNKVTWFTHNLVLCTFLFKNTLFCMYCGFINIELTVNRTITRAEWNSSNTCFPCKLHHSLLSLTRDSISALCLRVTLKSKMTNKMYTSAKNLALNRPQEGH